MPVTIRNYDGTVLAGSDGKVNDFTDIQSTKISVHKLPGADKDLVQKLGKSNRRITLKGFITTLVGSAFMEATRNNTGSISFSSNLGALTVVNVFYHELEWMDSGLRPLERRFILNAIEVI